MTTNKAPSRVSQWLKELARAGSDENMAKAVLNNIRDDNKASKSDREDFYRALAQQCFVWYLEALRGKPYTGDEMRFLVTHEDQKAQKES